VQILLKIG